MASVKLLVLAAVLAAVVLPQAAYAQQISTGQNNVCCAYILNSGGGWQLVCNNPTNIPGARPFPAGTIVSGQQLSPGVIAQCVGRFPQNPAPFRLPSNGVQLFTPPNGGRCAGQFSRFYQGLGPDGGFVVQCTN